jgi:hypothetical protein
MKNNCHYHTLYYDDRTVYVIRCTECENIQIGYGNMVITFTHCDFACFKNWIADMKSECQSSATKSFRNKVLPLPCEGIKFVISVNELIELDTMLESADSELLSLEMLKMFDSN